MYSAWLIAGDFFKALFFPDQESWTSRIMLSREESGWDMDVYINVRALDGRAYLAPCKPLTWRNGRKNEVEIDSASQFVLQDSRNGKEFTVAIRQCKRDELCFEKYVTPKRRIGIGRGDQMDIRNTNPQMSAVHGYLGMTQEGYIKYKDQSVNGTYFNGRKIQNQSVRLNFGDVLEYTSGLKIVYLENCIAVNRVGGTRVSGMEVWRDQTAGNDRRYEDRELPDVYVEYARAPRMLKLRTAEDVEIEAPIPKHDEKQMPVFLQLGPSMTMVLPMALGTIVGTGQFSLSSGLVMIGTSSMLAVMWGLINRRYRIKNEVRTERRRVELYRRYIGEVEQTLRNMNEEERKYLLSILPNAVACAEMAENGNCNLWSRMPGHPDFLEIRVGMGEVDMPCTITVPKEKLSLIDDELRNEPLRLKNEYKTIKDAPISISVRKESVIGILGETHAVLFAQGLLLQLASLHSYHDVRIAVLTDEGSASQWAWTRWLPHVFSNEDRDLRMVGHTEGDIHDIVSHIDEVVSIRKNSERPGEADDGDKASSPLPHYVIFCTDSRILEAEPAMRQLLTNQLGMTLIVIENQITHLPKECHIILNMEENMQGNMGHMHYSEGMSSEVNFEYPDRGLLNSFARHMAPLRVRDMAENAAIPTLVSFLDIYNVRRTEDLEVWRMWNENHTYEGLKSVIGYRAGSKPFVLDISDKYHGPHGLIAGTTGSGKSVMLETYILSLALNYSPKQIQFILIDYKGGGMADSFRSLPHVAGVIDNLQGERVIDRALASLNGEIKRREHIFKAAKVNNINDYTRQFGEMDGAAMSHLIIIVDEFAELKGEQPEFMRELVSASRVGRSLGVHLILATQKPSNSVSDEIWANSRFHLCLRVQTRQDSMEMLKRPDAAYIKGMGRCFIQIGNDELFEEVQTSYSGLTYKPDEPREEERPRMISATGHVVKPPKRNQIQKGEKEPTQMDAVLNRICEVAKEHDMLYSRMMWLQEMPRYVYLRDIDMFKRAARNGREYPNPQGGISIPLGLADDVANQRYLPFIVNLTEKRNLMITGLAGTGKTTLIQSMVYALCSIYDPSRLNIYILSLTSQTLGNLAAFPQVGDIAFEGEDIEIKRFINMLYDEAARRAELFAGAATDSFVEYNNARNKAGLAPEPAIVVFVDRYMQLREFFANDDFYTARIHTLIQEGSGRGIHFVVTAAAFNEVQGKLQPFFGGIALQLKERSDYSEAIGKRVPYEMPQIATAVGRGMGVLDGNIYEVQYGLGGAAFENDSEGFIPLENPQAYAITHELPAIEPLSDIERAEKIVAYAKQLNDEWKGKRPERIPRIPDRPDWNMLFKLKGFEEAQKTAFDIPIGYDMVQGGLATFNVANAQSWMVYGPKKSGISNCLKLLARVMKNRGADVHVIADSSWRLLAQELDAPLYETPERIVEFLQMFIENYAKPRKPLRAAAVEKGKAAVRAQAEQFKHCCILIDNAESIYARFNTPQYKNHLPLVQGLLGEIVEKGNYGFSIFMGISARERVACQSDPVKCCIAQGRAIALGGKLNDFDVCNVGASLPSKIKSAALPQGRAFVGEDGRAFEVVIPLAEQEEA